MTTALTDEPTADAPSLSSPSGVDPLPVLRMLPAPASEPPYDDELPHPPELRLLAPLVLGRQDESSPALAGPQPFDDGPLRVTPGGHIPLPLAQRALGRALVDGDAPRAAVPDGVELDDEAATAADALARRTAVAALPSPQRFCRALLQGLVEVLAGVRPVAQLQRDLTLDAYGELERAVGRAGRATGARPSLRAVRSLHVQTRPEGVAEVCATVERGTRPVAVALRLEGRDGAWQVTDLVGV